jgi:hypothetical protein
VYFSFYFAQRASLSSFIGEIEDMLLISDNQIALGDFDTREGSTMRRRLRKAGKQYDIIVVSMGGTGCTSMLAKLGKAKGRNNRFLMNNLNNEDMLKHSFPDRLKDTKVKYGVIYISGNFSLALKVSQIYLFASTTSLYLTDNEKYLMF